MSGYTLYQATNIVDGVLNVERSRGADIPDSLRPELITGLVRVTADVGVRSAHTNAVKFLERRLEQFRPGRFIDGGGI